MMGISKGNLLRQAVVENEPLQIVGTINAYTAMMAERVGHKAIYLSGGGVAAASFGMPDLGVTSLNDVLEDARRITSSCDLPLLVDIDTGWGGAFNISRTIKEMMKADVAGVHIEDQVMQKRCGHRPNKSIVTCEEMVDRIKAAVDARDDESFVIMARTDALAVEGINSAIDRALLCVEAGADMIFPEAVCELSQYQKFTDAVKVPILANITEFGQTPLFSCEQLADFGVKIVLYPLSAFRAMNKAALQVYETLLQDGSQQAVVETMQTREELYNYLNYHSYEQKLDELFSRQS
ncbi:methylisocitrate lyase [Thiotrichales bacterium HSG1]|nr:methylisocitrate lyase [Thiotrichales bacterium HSG1]